MTTQCRETWVKILKTIPRTEDENSYDCDILEDVLDSLVCFKTKNAGTNSASVTFFVRTVMCVDITLLQEEMIE